MKRILSLILAALLLASSLASCNGGEATETNPAETKAPETVESTETATAETETIETEAAETEANAPSFDTSLITENGEARAVIVLADTADSLEKMAAEELQYHIKKVSGAEASIVNTSASDSLSIVIGTPATVPALAELFPEDLAWLAELGEVGETEHYSDDGFAIRQLDGVIYIFGNTAKGALNGTYDFIEENMDVLWIRASEDIGLIYEEMPTITAKSVDYREKSPFAVRGWHLAGFRNYASDDTERMLARNKFNSSPGGSEKFGFVTTAVGHNVKSLVRNSPLYDPSVTEYWNTDDDGNHLSFEESPEINFYSDLTVEAVAASLLQQIEDYGWKCVFIGIEDSMVCSRVYPECTEPFEYAPGEFIEPNDAAYNSTVYFTFVNKVARIVGAKYPDVTVGTFSYTWTKTPPMCTLDENVQVVQATIEEDIRYPINDANNPQNGNIYNNLEGWKSKSNNMVFYNYYGCFIPAPLYCRPIWYKIQADLQYYASCGFAGVQPEGQADDGSSYGWHILEDIYGIRAKWVPDETNYVNSDEWATNALTFWIYGKLAWNPYEDVDALIEEFCDKAYGSASSYMKEYYAILYKGWEEGLEVMYDEFLGDFVWSTSALVHYDFFVNYNPEIRDGLLAALTNAYEAAEGSAKVRIGEMKDLYEEYIREFDM